MLGPFSVATLTTILGALISVTIGFVDVKTGMTLGLQVDALLIGGGLGALLGANPLTTRVP